MRSDLKPLPSSVLARPHPFAATLAVALSVMLFGCGRGNESSDAGNPHASADIVSPAAGDILHGTISIKVSSQGPTTTNLVLRVDGLEKNALIQLPDTLVFDTTTLSDGQHTFVAEVAGGGTNWTTPGLTATVDNTHPVASFSPAPGDSNVDVRAPITVSFSKPVDPTTVSNGSVTLSNGENLPTTVTLSSDHLSIRVNVTTPISAPADIQAVLDPGVKDTVGNTIVLPNTGWHWTIPAWQSLSMPATVSYPLQNAIAIAPSGSPSFVLPDSGNRYQLSGAAWTNVETIPFDPKPMGTFLATTKSALWSFGWTQDSGSAPFTHFRVYEGSSGWQAKSDPPSYLQNTAFTQAAAFTVTASPADDSVAISNENYLVIFSNGSWQEPLAAEVTKYATAAFLQDGTLLRGVLRSNPAPQGTWRIAFQHLKDSAGAWSDLGDVADFTTDIQTPPYFGSVTPNLPAFSLLNANGQTYLVWVNTAVNGLYASHLVGTTFSTPRIFVLTDPYFDPKSGVAISPNGDLLIASISSGLYGNTPLTLYWEHGGSWTTLTPPYEIGGGNIAPGFDSEGRPLFVYGGTSFRLNQ